MIPDDLLSEDGTILDLKLCEHIINQYESGYPYPATWAKKTWDLANDPDVENSEHWRAHNEELAAFEKWQQEDDDENYTAITVTLLLCRMRSEPVREEKFNPNDLEALVTIDLAKGVLIW